MGVVTSLQWSMKLRVQGQEEDQRGPGERLSERTVKHVNTVTDSLAHVTCNCDIKTHTHISEHNSSHHYTGQPALAGTCR